jgi:hypothetical protein
MAAWPRPGHKPAPLPLPSLERNFLQPFSRTLAESWRKRYPAVYAETALKVGLRGSLLCGARRPFFGSRNRVLPFFHAGFWFAGASPVTSETEDSP